jgi:hypothetical protein
VQCLDAACKTSLTLPGLDNVHEVAGSCAISGDAAVRCWRGDASARTTVAIRGAEHVTALAAAGDRACALASGHVMCWTGSGAATSIDLAR